MEAGLVIGSDCNPIQVHIPNGRSAGHLPDSRELWDFLWTERHRVLGFAHSHPGSGTPGPSYTDLTTFAAIEVGLGRRLFWWITSSDRMILVRKSSPESDYESLEIFPEEEPYWAADLRNLSNQEIPDHCSGCGKENKT